ncbi:ceramidase domain-containing protein [Marinobacterium arenosum]|uniref:ceramidase domain-containing protein n=1 Tax=Marinobacterium arenosum TaxID=2862496 RepID=UPI001C97E1A2|nr:ceramidase domain-containing protein [Marinobacterium arenosum]MBY4677944.1 hypothetical protein [Marinobacterium arenosum]
MPIEPPSQPRQWRSWRATLLISLSLLAAVVTWLLPPIAQPLSYHDFADQRTLLGIPNNLNVLSNLPLIAVALAGIWQLRNQRRSQMIGPFRFHYRLFFAAVLITGVGSIHYHLAPNNETLVIDRLGIAMALMALLSILVGEFINTAAGRGLFWPLTALGAISVLLWISTERASHGDLRLYLLLQTLATLLLVLILLLYRWRYSHQWTLGLAMLVYLLAKLCELLDRPIDDWSQSLISGHSLKHLLMAGAVYGLLWTLRHRRPIPASEGGTQ